MNAEQKVQDTIAFARQHYGDRRSIHRRTLLQHAAAVAKLAEQIGMKLYQDVREDFMSGDTQESLAIIVHSALLHDMINVSRCAFEEIAERTTVQIAAVVADLSRDYRLVETKRDMEFRGRLASSTVGAQVIAVADILCTTKEIIDMVNDLGVEAIPKARKILMQLDGDLLAIHAASRFYTLRLYVHAARNLLQDASKLIKECRTQHRQARAAAHSMRMIRLRIAERKAAEEAQQKPQPQETRRAGKKRTG